MTGSGNPLEDRLRIAIVHPTSWPQVRRGTERFMNELAAYLAQRGHRPTVICGKPGKPETRADRGFVTQYHRSLWHPWMVRVGVHPFHVFPLTTLFALAGGKFDVAHCFNFTDAAAAALARRFTGARVLLHLSSIPAATGYRRSLSSGGALFRHAVQVSDAVIAHGQSQADYFETRFGKRPFLIKAPVDTARFQPAGPKNLARPMVLSASALDERRKGGRFLMRAFNGLKERMPDAELHLCGRLEEALKRELLQMVHPEWHRDVVFHSHHDADLPSLYAAASVLAVPSLWEAFPLVVLEALSAGTPVVGTRDGGIPELISSADIGRTFAPGPIDMSEPSNVEGMVEALIEAIALNRDPRTAERCRAAAAHYGWETVGPDYVNVYRRLCGGAGGKEEPVRVNRVTPKILIAGAGRFGAQHLKEWQLIEADGLVTIAGVVVSTEASRRRVEAQFGVRAWTALTPEILQEADAVDIVTPSSTHFALAKECLEHTNVLTEKPLAMTGSEARELERLAAGMGRVLQVNHLFRFHPVLKRVRELAGETRERPLIVHGAFLQKLDKTLPANLSPNHEFLHFFDAMDYLFGEVPETVLSERRGSLNRVSLRYGGPGKAPLNAVLRLGWHAGAKTRTLDLEYSDHKINADFLTSVVSILHRDRMEKILLDPNDRPLRAALLAFLSALNGHAEAGTGAATAARIVELAECALPGPRKSRPRVGVIGGGVFGASCALEFAPHADVTLFERHPELMSEASFQNQWRFHSGFHYPRSVQTVQEIQTTRGAFYSVFGDAVIDSVTSYYCTSGTGTEITRERYLAACTQNKLTFEIEETPPPYVNADLIDLCLKTDESVFDFYKLRAMAGSMLAAQTSIEVALNTEVVGGDIERGGKKQLLSRKGSHTRHDEFDYLINTTYANINITAKWFHFPVRRLRFDYCEMLVLELPMPNVSLTVLDGPFCSLVSTGRDGVFILSHVNESVLRSRTPVDGLPPLWDRPQSNAANLIGGCAPYFPILKDARFIESRFGVRAVEAVSDDYDGRPTVVTDYGFGCWSVLGGKIGTCVANAREILYRVFPHLETRGDEEVR